MAPLATILCLVRLSGGPAEGGPKPQPLVAQLERLAAGGRAPGLKLSFRSPEDDCLELTIVAEPSGVGLVCRPALPDASSHRCPGVHDRDLTAVLSSIVQQRLFTRRYAEERPRHGRGFVFRLTDGSATVEKTFQGTPPALEEVVGRLHALGRACAPGGPSPTTPLAPIGTATMTTDGTIVLDLSTTGPGMTHGEARLLYPPNHKEYRAVLEHLGGLRPGETKPVWPWPEAR
jgi:hypothetical protein